MCTKKELEAVENALLRILQEENPRPAPQHELRKAELSRRLSDGADSEKSDASLTSSVEHGLDSKDVTLLSKLLNQVRHFNIDQTRDAFASGDLSPVETGDFQKTHMCSKQSHVAAEIALGRSEKMADNVVDVASAAAEAAKAAASATAKNIEVMESLLGTNKLKARHGKTNESCGLETSEEDCSEASPIDKKAKKLVKSVERQNRITHWMLGIMMVTTLIWRFKVLSMALGFKKTISNPFQAIGDLFDGVMGPNKEEPNGTKPFQKARTAIPSLLQDRGNGINEKVGKATSEDSNVGEGLARALDNIFSGGTSFSDQTKGNTSSDQSEQ